MLLNIAEICAESKTLGPGKRFIIWVQGCCFNCQGCISPDWIPQTKANIVDPFKLADHIISLPDIDGITISGGEPMLQGEALAKLLTYIRQKKDLSVISYTCFTLSQLQTKKDNNINLFLSLIDVLIDGQYMAELNDNQGWRGSSNQKIHFLTNRHLKEIELFTQRKRDVEVHIRDESALMVGVPPFDFKEKFALSVMPPNPPLKGGN